MKTKELVYLVVTDKAGNETASVMGGTRPIMRAKDGSAVLHLDYVSVKKTKLSDILKL